MFNQSSTQLVGNRSVHFNYPSETSVRAAGLHQLEGSEEGVQVLRDLRNDARSSGRQRQLGSVSRMLPMDPSINHSAALFLEERPALLGREEDYFMFDEENVRCDCPCYDPLAHEQHRDEVAFECNGYLTPRAFSNSHHEDPSIL